MEPVWSGYFRNWCVPLLMFVLSFLWIHFDTNSKIQNLTFWLERLVLIRFYILCILLKVGPNYISSNHLKKIFTEVCFSVGNKRRIARAYVTKTASETISSSAVCTHIKQSCFLKGQNQLCIALLLWNLSLFILWFSYIKANVKQCQIHRAAKTEGQEFSENLNVYVWVHTA